MLCVLGFRMAVLTIVEGQEYRAIADIKKIKDIPVKAPRGKILDRNGILLADNVSSFTVQMYTDEIDSENFNEISYILSSILDKNGEKPIDEFPIELDTFEYVDESLESQYTIVDNQENVTISNDAAEILSYVTAEEKVIQSVKDNIAEWLNYETILYDEAFNPKEMVLNTILRDIEVPVKIENGQFLFSQVNDDEEKETGNTETNVEQTVDLSQLNQQQTGSNDEITDSEEDPLKKWLIENELNENLNPEQVIGQLLVKNKKYLSGLFSNSKIRKHSYDFIVSKGLDSNIQLVEYSFKQDENFKNIKRSLNANHEEITETTSAKDDFVL